MAGAASRKKPQRTPLTTACAVLPTNATSLPVELLKLSQSPCSLGYPSERLDTVNTWAFDNLLNGPHEFLESYKATIAPLVRRTLRGEHTVVTFGGSVSISPLEYMAAKSTTPGFLGLAARQLLDSTTHLGEKLAKVTFTWFKIDAGSSEAITDVLRSSSTPGSAPGRGPDPALVLREIGKGRGLQVAGLWEVELTNVSDVEAVLTHVTKITPAATHFGDAHTVFQLIVTPIKTSTGNSIKTIDDSVPSRLSFLVLSNLSAPSSSAQAAGGPQKPYPWVDQFGELLLWVESRRPSPPFHKSRILLFLRDALMGKMNSALILLIQPAQNMVVENNAWLRLWANIQSVCLARATMTSTNAANVSITSSNKVSAPGQRQPSPGRASGALSPPPPPPPPMSPKPVASPAASGLALPSSILYPAVAGSPRQRLSDSKKNMSTPSKSNQSATNSPDSEDEDDFSFEAIRRKAPGSLVPPQGFPVGSIDGTFPAVDGNNNESRRSRMESYSPSLPQGMEVLRDSAQRSKDIAGSLHYASHSSASPGRGGLQRKALSSQPPLQQPLTLSGAMSRMGSTPGRRPQSTSKELIADLNASLQKELPDINATLDPTDLAALLEALHASREEIKSLKQSLKAAEDNVAYLTRQYEKLVTRVQEEGYYLRAKEREKLRAALKDLRDYELYKEVLESAMQRMNVEMDALIQQNRTLREENTMHERNVRKQKIGVFKSSKEVEDAMKEVRAKERSIRELQDTLSTRTRERDEALASVAQMRLVAGRKEADLSAKLAAQTSEKQAVKTKLDEFQAKYRSSEQDRSKALDVAKQELEKLRASNRATLDKCSALQEENEMLRSSLSEIIEAQQQQQHLDVAAT